MELTMSEITKTELLNRYVKNNKLRLPERFKNKTLLNFTNREVEVELALKAVYAGESLFISGACGTGKTHLACGLTYEWFISQCRWIEVNGEKQMSSPTLPVFLPTTELFLRLKASFDNNRVSELDILDEYSNAKLLIIDDIGVEKITDWSRQVFYTLIDRRYRNMKQTIITSNLYLDEISKNIDDRIVSRLIEMGKIIKLDGQDQRLKI